MVAGDGFIGKVLNILIGSIALSNLSIHCLPGGGGVSRL